MSESFLCSASPNSAALTTRKTDFDGHPIAFDLTGGEKSDAPHFPILLGHGPDIDPGATVGD
ncbi:hypothetical protein ACFPK2_20885, partial [Bosea minatitlanensis]|nr:hypothetical protein [Bosea minatitlanensis]